MLQSDTKLGIGSWPARRARITPERVALLHGERSCTYAQLAERTARFAGVLTKLGVRAGDRVAYFGPNHPAFLESLFAVGSLGAIFVPLNTRLAAPEIAYMLANSGSSVLISDATLSATTSAAIGELGALRHVITVGSSSASAVAGALGYEGEMQDSAADSFCGAGLDDPCMIIYTSGTTGSPKGAVISHGNVTWNMFNQLAHVDILSSDLALGIAPWFHTAGLNQVTMPTLFKGGRVIVTSVFDPGTLLRDVQERGITSFSAVPTMLQAIVDHPSWDSTDVSSLRHVVYGGSPVLDRVARAWVARGVPVLQGYGMTETSPGVLMAVPDGASARPTSTGVPHFFTDVAVLDERQEVQAANGQTGEMVVRGPNVFSGYWGRPADTRRSFSDDGWFRTGDVVRVEPDGWTYVVDRIKDVIISGGENVYPAEVEAVLATLPGVQACAVVATPDERWGEVGVAFVVLAPEATGSESALTEQLRARLARYKVPRSILFVDEIPTTVTGKIRRNELRERALSL